jgi:hypothetical protein
VVVILIYEKKTIIKKILKVGNSTLIINLILKNN